MKFLGKVIHPKDVTTKEFVEGYVDEKCRKIEEEKVSHTEVEEYSSEDVQTLWSQVFSSKNN